MRAAIIDGQLIIAVGVERNGRDREIGGRAAGGTSDQRKQAAAALLTQLCAGGRLERKRQSHRWFPTHFCTSASNNGRDEDDTFDCPVVARHQQQQCPQQKQAG
uniref:Uncharacterized protein n=1 Tax=Plectus sambesii TaxID=2011161 RepID=A0A914V6W7_9BILA